jgi:hypothetical protein
MKRRVHDSDMINNEIIKTYHHYSKLHFFLIADNIWRVPYLGRISCAKLSGCRMQNAKPPLLHRTCLKKKTQIRREHVEQTASGVKSEAGEKPSVINTSGSRGGQKIKLADYTKNSNHHEWRKKSSLELPTHLVSFLSM